MGNATASFEGRNYASVPTEEKRSATAPELKERADRARNQKALDDLRKSTYREDVRKFTRDVGRGLEYAYESIFLETTAQPGTHCERAEDVLREQDVLSVVIAGGVSIRAHGLYNYSAFHLSVTLLDGSWKQYSLLPDPQYLRARVAAGNVGEYVIFEDRGVFDFTPRDLVVITAPPQDENLGG